MKTSKATLAVLLHRYHRGYFNDATSATYEISCQAEFEIRSRFNAKGELIRMLWKKLMAAREEVKQLKQQLEYEQARVDIRLEVDRIPQEFLQ